MWIVVTRETASDRARWLKVLLSQVQKISFETFGTTDAGTEKDMCAKGVHMSGVRSLRDTCETETGDVAVFPTVSSNHGPVLSNE